MLVIDLEDIVKVGHGCIDQLSRSDSTLHAGIARKDSRRTRIKYKKQRQPLRQAIQ